MGFSLSELATILKMDKTTHHFILRKNDGVIQVSANDPNDDASKEHIRMHLCHVAKNVFGKGISMFRCLSTIRRHLARMVRKAAASTGYDSECAEGSPLDLGSLGRSRTARRIFIAG